MYIEIYHIYNARFITSLHINYIEEVSSLRRMEINYTHNVHTSIRIIPITLTKTNHLTLVVFWIELMVHLKNNLYNLFFVGVDMRLQKSDIFGDCSQTENNLVQCSFPFDVYTLITNNLPLVITF